MVSRQKLVTNSVFVFLLRKFKPVQLSNEITAQSKVSGGMLIEY